MNNSPIISDQSEKRPLLFHLLPFFESDHLVFANQEYFPVSDAV